MEGSDILKEMVQSPAESLSIIPTGRITDKNIDKIHGSITAPKYDGRRIVGELS